MQRQRPPRHLGLTGGIGSGKSTVGGMLAALGAALIDADQIARSLTAPGGAAMGAIRAQFGAEFVDAQGALDRNRMRELAFNEPQSRSQLERIIHPLVGLHTQQKAQEAADRGSVLIVFDIPLLAESGHWAQRLDAIVVVDCPPEVQVARVVQRSGLAPDVVQGIINAQASRSVRRHLADIVLHNGADCTLAQLQNQTRQTATLFGL